MFLIKPITWVVLALLGAAFIKKEKLKKWAFYLGLGILLFFSNPFLCNVAWNAWEPDPVEFNEVDSNYDVAIILGGYTHPQQRPRDRVHFNESYDRLSRGIELYLMGKVDKILLSGGSAQVIGEKVKAAIITKKHLLRKGIPEEDIIMEAQSRNTHENAVYTTKILNNRYPDGKFVLVTSAFHMFRAKHCFIEEGLEFDTFPTDFRGREFKLQVDNLILPSANVLASWEIMIKEWVGIVAYWVMGYV